MFDQGKLHHNVCKRSLENGAGASDVCLCLVNSLLRRECYQMMLFSESVPLRGGQIGSRKAARERELGKLWPRGRGRKGRGDQEGRLWVGGGEQRPPGGQERGQEFVCLGKMGKEPSEAKGVTALQGHHAQMRRREAVEREGGGQRWPGREARRARLFRKQRFGLEHQEPGAAEQECEQERRAARAGAGL